MKVVILGFFNQYFKKKLIDENLDVYYCDDITKSYSEHLKEADIIVIRSPFKLNKKDINKSTKLKYIIRAGRGTDNIDSSYKNKDIKLQIIQGNGNAVAEQVIGYILMHYRFLDFCNNSVKSGKWEKNQILGREIKNKNVGILGLGYIGKLVAKKLLILDSQVSVYDRSLFKEEKKKFINDYDIQRKNIKKIFNESDIIVNCLPLNSSTKNLINLELLLLMKQGSMLIEVGRGGVTNINDLYNYLIKHKDRFAAIDVYEKEPPGHSEIFQLENIIFTPHTGAQTVESRTLIEEKCYEYIKEILKGFRDENRKDMGNYSY